MFISEEESEARLNNPRNIFSPEYKPEDEESSEDRSEQEEENEPPSKPNPDLDKLLSGADDPYRIRNRTRNLNGNTDAQVGIGATSHILGPRMAAPLFGLGISQAQAYKEGLSSTGDRGVIQRSPERSARLKSVKEQLGELAGKRLKTALTSLTAEKIDSLSGPKISGIAKDMAVVLDKVTKETSRPESVHFHLFRPESKTVNQYEIVNVSSPLIIPSSD